MICLVNGSFMPVEEASIGIQDLALIRGYGIFDFFRLAKGVPLFIDDHLHRFYQGASRVRLDPGIAQSELKDQIFELIQKNQMSESGIRIVLTGGVGGGPYGIGKPNLIITQEPISFPSKEKYEQGVKLITHEYLRDIPEVKTINYMTGIWLQEEVSRQKAFDVLYVFQGTVQELTRSNIYAVTSDEVLVTPKENMLHGITRKHLLDSVRKEIAVEERILTVEELKGARELFLTGTTKRVLPIVQIDESKIGTGKPGHTTHRLMQLFKELEMNYIQQNQD